MALDVISVGFGRTGTMSLRIALAQLGAAPCYHMDNVLNDMPLRVPHWTAALEGQPDWDTTFAGFSAAVDWPTACFWRELASHYPDARIILSSRSPERWYQSFSQTILAVISAPDKWPDPQREWLEMCHRLIAERQFGGKLSEAELIDAFKAHETAVQATIPPGRLLVHHPEDGWEPLCAFLDKDVPENPYPRTNSRQEFFDLLARG